eukprot:768065-Hanusia_phi.AAC.1
MGAYSAIRYKEVPHIKKQYAITEDQHNHTMIGLMRSHSQAHGNLETSNPKQNNSTFDPSSEWQNFSGTVPEASIQWHISRLEELCESRAQGSFPSEDDLAIRIHAVMLHWFSRLGWSYEAKKTHESSIFHMLDMTFKEIEKLQNEKLKHKFMCHNDSYGSDLRSISRINDSASTKSIHLPDPKDSPSNWIGWSSNPTFSNKLHPQAEATELGSEIETSRYSVEDRGTTQYVASRIDRSRSNLDDEDISKLRFKMNASIEDLHKSVNSLRDHSSDSDDFGESSQPGFSQVSFRHAESKSSEDLRQVEASLDDVTRSLSAQEKAVNLLSIALESSVNTTVKRFDEAENCIWKSRRK